MTPTRDLPPSNLLDDEHRPQRFVALGGAIVATLAGNMAVLGSYFLDWIGLGEVLWTYWLQSVVIGLFNFVRMMRLEQFSTVGLTSNGRPVPETPAGKRSAAIFFLFHYGFFHAGYAVFLGVQYGRELQTPWLGVTVLSFIVGEWFSFGEHRAMDRRSKPNLGTMMFLPYLRIIPMHLTIIFGGMTAAGAVFFPLKILADMLMLLVDHNLDRKRPTIDDAEPVEPA